jgi:hypothetical protein
VRPAFDCASWAIAATPPVVAEHALLMLHPGFVGDAEDAFAALLALARHCTPTGRARVFFCALAATLIDDDGRALPPN